MASLGLAATGCSDLIGGGCKTFAAPSFTVLVQDATTGKPIARGATVIWHGPVTDSVTISDAMPALDSLGIVGPFETKGRFDITVRRAGYQTWSSSVTVSGDRCHVTPSIVTAKLQPLK